MSEAIHLHPPFCAPGTEVHKVKCANCRVFIEIGSDKFHEINNWLGQIFQCDSCRDKIAERRNK